MFIKRGGDGSWSSPKVANLRGNNESEMEAFYTSDGEQLYFTSGDTTDTNRIWRSVKVKSGWSIAELLNFPVNNTPVFWATFSNTNTNVNETCPSISPDGKFIFLVDIMI